MDNSFQDCKSTAGREGFTGMDQQPMAGTSGCGDSIDMQRVNLEGNMFMEQWNEYLEVLASKAPTPGGGCPEDPCETGRGENGFYPAGKSG